MAGSRKKTPEESSLGMLGAAGLRAPIPIHRSKWEHRIRLLGPMVLLGLACRGQKPTSTEPDVSGGNGVLEIRVPDPPEGASVWIELPSSPADASPLFRTFETRWVKTPSYRLEAPLGVPIRVRASGSGYLPFDRTITIAPGSRQEELVVTMTEESFFADIRASDLPRDSTFQSVVPQPSEPAQPLFEKSSIGSHGQRTSLVVDTKGSIFWRHGGSESVYALVGHVDHVTLGRMRDLVDRALKGSLLSVGDGLRDAGYSTVLVHQGAADARGQVLAEAGERPQRRDSVEARTIACWVLAIKRDFDRSMAPDE